METMYRVTKCKHGRDWDCDECDLEERRVWAKADAISAVKGVRDDIYQYANSGIMFLIEALIDELIDWEEV